ncbi:MAG: LysR family transcriptional regulator, partial [Pseudomonadota bacterium]
MNINNLDLNLLRVFHALAQERSVTRTAERLDLSQPAVSNALKRLRRELDDELFVRGRGGMVPTPRGESLAEAVSEALAQVETALVGGPDVDPSRIDETISIVCADEEIALHGAAIMAALERDGCRAPIQFLPLNTDYRSEVLWRNRLALTISTMLFAPDG